MSEDIPEQLRTSLPAVEKQSYPLNLRERWEPAGDWWEERVRHKIDPYQKYKEPIATEAASAGTTSRARTISRSLPIPTL